MLALSALSDRVVSGSKHGTIAGQASGLAQATSNRRQIPFKCGVRNKHMATQRCLCNACPDTTASSDVVYGLLCMHISREG